MPDSEIPQPTLSPPFTTHPSTAPFAVPASIYLSTHNTTQDPEIKHTAIATGALVFHRPSTPGPQSDSQSQSQSLRILLIQRAAHDSMPARWEIPGGACDDEDQSILHGVARELWEETGLRAVRIGPGVGAGCSFLTRGGRVVRKVSFLVECEGEGEGDGDGDGLRVRLDPREHQGFVWATEEEVRGGRVGDVDLQFTTREQVDVVLEGFRVKRELEMSRN